MISKPENGDASNPEPGGPGDEYPISKRAENKLVASMLNKRNRWRLKASHRSKAVAVTVANMENEDGRISNGAVANMIRMESQNQADEHKDSPDLHLHRMEHVVIELPAKVPIIDAPSNSNGNGNGFRRKED